MSDSIYNIDIFEPLESDLEAYRETYTMAAELWRKFRIDDLPGVDFTKWKEEKLIENGKFSSKLSQIPNSFGGIYIYSIEPNIIPNTGCYVMYIGKASKTKYENLRVRVKSYQRQIGSDYDRDRLHRLFVKWGDYVHVHYLAINSTNEVITALEDRLIAAYGKPRCNSDVRVESVKKATRAFS